MKNLDMENELLTKPEYEVVRYYSYSYQHPN